MGAGEVQGTCSEVTRKRDGIYLTQAKYISKILHDFNMHNASGVDIPMTPRFDLSKGTKIDSDYYRSAIGALMFLSNSTRPDISVAVNTLSRKVTKPTHESWNAFKRIFRYLRKTEKLGIFYPSGKDDGTILKTAGVNVVGANQEIYCFVDSDYARDLETRRITTGVLIYHNGGNHRLDITITKISYS